MDTFKEKTPNPQGCQAKGNGVSQFENNNTTSTRKCKFSFSIEQVAHAFFKAGEVVEIRALNVSGKGRTQSGYFNDFEKMARCARELDRKKQATGIYFVLNPVMPELLARSNNRIIPAKSTTTDDQVICQRWLIIDIDTKGPTGISATDHELKQAYTCRKKIMEHLGGNEQWPEPICCMSGNGYHALYMLNDLPVTDEITQFKRDCLKALSRQFSNDAVTVDEKVSNPGRIIKLYGTLARKGDPLPDRPHRRAHVETIPANIKSVTVKQLQQLASQTKQVKKESANANQFGSIGKMNVQAYLSHYGIEIVNVRHKKSVTFYCLKHCVFNSDHADNEAAIVQGDDGKLLYQCFHNSCQGQTWADARKVISGSDSLGSFIDDCVLGARGLALNTQSGQLRDVWESPILLDDIPLPFFSSELLPGAVGAMVEAVTIATETPRELAAGLIVSVLGAACQGKFYVLIKPKYSEPVNVWINAVLGPANRKSAVLRQVTAPLLAWEKLKRDEMASSVREAEARLDNQKARIKFLRGNYGKAKPEKLEDIEAEILEIEKNLVEIPRVPKIWAQDVTPEHLGTLMADHNERMSILSAEGGIFDILNGRYSNGIPNLDLFLQAHAGDAVKVDRGSRDPVYLDQPALTLGLSTQPEVLRGLISKPGFMGRGLLARFLYLLPKSNLGYRTLDTKPVPEDTEEEYCSLINSLLDIEVPQDDRGKTQPYVLNLSKDSYREWFNFAKVIEKDMREGCRFEYIRAWAGKIVGAAARIAGLLHCAENPCQPWAKEISFKTMSSALELASIFAGHAIAAFDLMGADKSLEQARKIWRWVERKRKQSFSQRDCFNDLRGSFHKVANMKEPFGILKERNYIKESEQTVKVGRPSIQYQVNPELVERWS